MSTALTTQAGSPQTAVSDVNDYVTIRINGQLFGIPVLEVHDVLKPMNLTRVPMAPPEIAGVLNLRGRIVTVVDLRVRLNLPPRDADADRGMSIVVEHRGELYSLSVDQVGEVMSCPAVDFQSAPPTLAKEWLQVADGIYRLSGTLLVVLNTGRLLEFTDTENV